ncbi:MAG: beta-lactamase family protein [Oscillospiraceae bacterium]|nr:beta-lactamase family protein [Oscillospiraceae bacterium]
MKKPLGRKTVIKAAAAVIIAVLLITGGLAVYENIQMSKIPALSFEDTLLYTTGGNKSAVITVGVIKHGEASYTVYGEDGKVLDPVKHTYEIGSLTKTFTAAMINKAISEGRAELDDTIDKYLDLPEGNTYPTIKELLTHTSGYKGYYLETPMIGNRVKGRNDYCGVTRDMLLERAGKLDMNKDSYGYEYSNFGYAMLGLVLESIYDTDYTSLINEYAAELGLMDTHVSTQDGDLGNCWEWQDTDAYIPAGAVTSDIEDMLRYAELQLEDDRFAVCHESLCTVNGSSEQYRMMDINIDDIGMAWVIDKKNGIVFHNGGTGKYNCYLGIDRENGNAVVILSNMAPGYRIPATVMGVKLLNELAAEK